MSNDPPFLDVEDDDQRQNRIGSLLEQLNTTSPSSSLVSPNPLLNIGRERVTDPIKPPSELLARIKAFLPIISASNEALAQQKPEDIDIENVSEGAEQYIEMNLGLGLFETKRRVKRGTRTAGPSSETESEPMSDVSSSESGSDPGASRLTSGEDSDDSTFANDDDSDAPSKPPSPVDMKPISSRPLKPLPRAKIEV